MGRELRRVPPGWEHPKDDRGRYQPLYDQDYESALREWIEDGKSFVAGEDVKYGPDDSDYPRTWTGYALWFGNAPDVEYHRPRWEDSEASHYQVYETVSEGTPVSPVLATREAVVEWWVTTGDAFSGKLSREQAERWVEAGASPSFAIVGNRLIGGAQL